MKNEKVEEKKENLKTRIKKNADAIGRKVSYKYTDLAQINEHLEKQGITYHQITETEDGHDYIYTIPIINGEEQAPRRGVRIVDATLYGNDNPAQKQGSAVTYARRYSLLMAFGLATEDDDAQSLNIKQNTNTYKNQNNIEQVKIKKLSELRMNALEQNRNDKEKIIVKAVLAKYKINEEKLGKISEQNFKELQEKVENQLKKLFEKEVAND